MSTFVFPAQWNSNFVPVATSCSISSMSIAPSSFAALARFVHSAPQSSMGVDALHCPLLDAGIVATLVGGGGATPTEDGGPIATSAKVTELEKRDQEQPKYPLNEHALGPVDESAMVLDKERKPTPPKAQDQDQP
ncbi:hypothetical protein SUGI_0749450 [Cryptomeria japonica]|nr:hypothetical protein SUGI_0749450 [Cryptomeria japonica]